MHVARAGHCPQRHGNAFDKFVALVLIELPLIEFFDGHHVGLSFSQSAAFLFDPP